jgi:hypothetical protein
MEMILKELMDFADYNSVGTEEEVLIDAINKIIEDDYKTANKLTKGLFDNFNIYVHNKKDEAISLILGGAGWDDEENEIYEKLLEQFSLTEYTITQNKEECDEEEIVYSAFGRNTLIFNFKIIKNKHGDMKIEQLSAYEILETKLKDLYCNELVDILLSDEQIIIDFEYSTEDDESDEKIQDFVDYIAGYDYFDEDNQCFIRSSTFKKIKELYPEEFSYLPKKAKI